MHNEPHAVQDNADDTRIRILEAITGGLLLRAEYNRQELILAPTPCFPGVANSM